MQMESQCRAPPSLTGLSAQRSRRQVSSGVERKPTGWSLLASPWARRCRRRKKTTCQSLTGWGNRRPSRTSAASRASPFLPERSLRLRIHGAQILSFMPLPRKRAEARRPHVPNFCTCAGRTPSMRPVRLSARGPRSAFVRQQRQALTLDASGGAAVFPGLSAWPSPRTSRAALPQAARLRPLPNVPTQTQDHFFLNRNE